MFSNLLKIEPQSHIIDSESSRLEKTAKTICSNHQPITPCPLTMSISVISTRFFNASGDSDSTPPPCAAHATASPLLLGRIFS